MDIASYPWVTKPSLGQLAQGVSTVVADLPRFGAAPLFRRVHRRWGATTGELSDRLPGDGLLPTAQYRATRAITIDAPPEQVWPWLVQVGCLRAGFYSNDLLDNLSHPSASEIVPELQQVKVGQWMPMSPTPSDATAFKVAGFEPNRWMLWRKPDSTWVWRLTPARDGKTRLLTRVHAVYDWTRPSSALLSVVLMELGDYAMMRRMLLGIKRRAETTAAANVVRASGHERAYRHRAVRLPGRHRDRGSGAPALRVPRLRHRVRALFALAGAVHVPRVFAGRGSVVCLPGVEEGSNKQLIIRTGTER